MNKLLVGLIFIYSGAVMGRNLDGTQGLEKGFCAQVPEHPSCGRSKVEPSAPKNQAPIDIADRYKQDEFNNRYKKVLRLKGCQPDPGSLDPTRPEACLMALSNFVRECPPGQYVVQGTGATVYTEACYVEDIVFRNEHDGFVAYVIDGAVSQTLHRVQASRYVPPGVGMYGKCVFPSPDDYLYKQYPGGISGKMLCR